MAAHSLLAWLVIGAVAGWLASVLTRGGGYGLFMDILIGILGACLGDWLAHQAGLTISGGFVASIIVAMLGAVLLLVALRTVERLLR